ncbi:MAG: methyl-viologen-reducing hydrogenase subunit delta [Candidatus Margulisiibacteriota bacterium]|nr:MAG: methyl-viologen-reducing hydrogenase subunit delta [Candidatus Margulisbacteria bacterium GWD2_39_127]PZM80074.1 MAG: methyl-viologen-reducing hydrogenase subunit delta [Candidatus Margulisiibacteriota bacterium]HAR62855.1 methyl-viologen-reducing hydrogenase subunit delta [Candidatus Margulisiibacteriota bacterium]HCY35809.1 methyl-viologen-reducing hydrogenase subunit delta [Candidatus Margulisiibacteriota bacterium]
MSDEFEPKIIAFVCNWCSYGGADSAGNSRLKYNSGVKLVRVMCSGRIDPQFVLEAYKNGADGVLVLGCHPGDCHYQNGNYKTLKRAILMEKMLDQFGIEKDRFILDWVAASEGQKFAAVVNQAYDNVKALGPLNIRTLATSGKELVNE